MKCVTTLFAWSFPICSPNVDGNNILSELNDIWYRWKDAVKDITFAISFWIHGTTEHLPFLAIRLLHRAPRNGNQLWLSPGRRLVGEKNWFRPASYHLFFSWHHWTSQDIQQRLVQIWLNWLNKLSFWLREDIPIPTARARPVTGKPQLSVCLQVARRKVAFCQPLVNISNWHRLSSKNFQRNQFLQTVVPYKPILDQRASSIAGPKWSESYRGRIKWKLSRTPWPQFWKGPSCGSFPQTTRSSEKLFL